MSIEHNRSYIEDKILNIFETKNKSELLALDFEINLLICSAQSYKHESVLRPFPSTFLSDSNNHKNTDKLLNALLSLPSVLEWKNSIKKFNADQLAIIYWILIHKNYKLEYCTDMNQDKLKEASKYTKEFSKPSHIFEIKYSEDKIKKFDLLKEKAISAVESDNVSISSICFHGTRMDNLYSILHMGLLSHLNKNGLFGEGTYLSQEPSMSLHYSPSCNTWNKSIIGQRMSCLLVCETINHPMHVKIGKNNSTDANKIPDTYYIVKNNDYVRVKYVLLYAEKRQFKAKTKLSNFVNNNKFLILVICYSILLASVGILNSKFFHRYFKLSYRKFFNYLLGEAAYANQTE